MSSFDWPDLSRLALSARDQNRDVRPVLLRAHTDLFVGAPSRDRATIEAFEALALGFLPIVDDATAALVAERLAPIADTPPTIIDALIRRGGAARKAILAQRKDAVQHPDAPPWPDHPWPDTHENSGGRDVQEPRASEEDDLALARDRYASLGSARLQALVARGRERPQLAMALLERGDLGAADEAVLYLHASDARRTEIRARLEPLVRLVRRGRSLARAEKEATNFLLAAAHALDVAAFEAQLADMLGLAPAPAWRFQMERRRELLALALVAAGLAPEDCIRVFLTLHPAISRSVGTVFRLAQVARSVPRSVAIHLVEAILDVAVGVKPESRYVPAADPSVAPARQSASRPTVAQIRAKILARRAG